MSKKLRASVSLDARSSSSHARVVSAAVAQVVPLNDHFLSRSTVIYTDVSPQGVRVDHSLERRWPRLLPDYGDRDPGLDGNSTDRIANKRSEWSFLMKPSHRRCSVERIQ